MESDKVLLFNPDTKEYVKKLYNLDKPEKMDQAVQILRDWLTKQNHFTKKDYDRQHLESLLIDTKGSIEKAKDKLEKRCIFRTVLPHFFEFDNLQDDFGDILANTISGFPLPKLTKDHNRVIIYKLYDNEYFKKFTFFSYSKLTFIINEYLKLRDCCAGYYYFVDLSSVSIWDVIAFIKPKEFQQWSTYFLEVQGMRLKTLTFITPSPVIENLIKLIRPLFSKKMSERIGVCKNLEELHKIVPKDVLPVEYGGTDIRIQDVQDEWIKVLSSKEFTDYYNDMRNAIIDQKIKKLDNSDAFVEMAGSFVSLNVD